MRFFFTSLLCAFALTGCPKPPAAADSAVPDSNTTEATKKETAKKSDTEEQAPNSKSLVGNEVDFSCKQDSDCAVKDIGSCCGGYPACVNKDSPTFPEQVKADCIAKGMASICGFSEISSCKCVANRCQDISSGQPEEAIK